MAIPEYNEKQRLYSSGDSEPDDEVGHGDVILPRWHLARIRSYWPEAFSTAFSLATVAVSLLGAFALGAFIAVKVFPSGTAKAYCKLSVTHDLLPASLCAKQWGTAPASEALISDVLVFMETEHSPYAGRPSSQIDLAWTTLLQCEVE
jgi:hypothetical protein